MFKTVSVSELRLNLPKNSDRYAVTRRGKPEVILMSVDDYEGLMETLEIVADKKMMKDFKQAEEDLKRGKGRSLDEIKLDIGI